MTTPSPSEKLDPQIWRVLLVVLLGPFMTQMDSTVVNVSLAAIRDDLHSTIGDAQWIITSYLLALALMLPLNGWLVDRFGAKRLYLGCFSAFTLTSLFCGLASTMDQLILARVFQGMAGGLLAPMTQLMIARVAGRNLARVIGYAAVPILLAPILGPVLAGAILKYANWQWLFYINLPVGVVAVILAVFLLPQDEETRQRRPFDLLGLILISPGIALILYGLEKISHHQGALPLFVGAILLAGFCWDAKKKKTEALIDLSLFKNLPFTNAVFTQFLSNGVIYAGQFLVPLYLIQGCALSSTAAGWMIAPMGVGMLCVYPCMGMLVDRFGYRKTATAGVFFNFIGTLPFLWMIHNHFSQTLTVAALVVRGAGQGATGIPSMAAAYNSVSKEKLPFANTALNIVQRLGGPVATTIMAVVLSFSIKNEVSLGSSSGGQAFLMPFIALIALQLTVFISANRLPHQIASEVSR